MSDIIKIKQPSALNLNKKARMEDQVSRFCFAAAALPSPIINQFLDLLEACDDSFTIQSHSDRGNA